MTEPTTALPSDQLLDALEAAVFVFGHDGRLLFANRRARRELEAYGEPYAPEQPFAGGLEFLDQSGRPLEPHELPPVHSLRTGAVLTAYSGDQGSQAAGQGVLGVVLDGALTAGGFDDQFDRAANDFARRFKAWLAAGA